MKKNEKGYRIRNGADLPLAEKHRIGAQIFSREKRDTRAPKRERGARFFLHHEFFYSLKNQFLGVYRPAV